MHHTNTRKYVARYKKCRFVACAYSHEKEEDDLNIEVIQKDNNPLKARNLRVKDSKQGKT